MTPQEKQTLIQIQECLSRVHVLSDEQSLQSMLWAQLAIKNLVGGVVENGNTDTQS